MRHVVVAKRAMPPVIQKFISIENEDDVKGVSPIISFSIQSDPISEVGLNGVQASDIIDYCWHLIFSLNSSLPCMENELTLCYLSQASDAQKLRTRNRLTRGVEGKNEI